ncbi:hypothetical protein [Thiohalocapsa sp. ML1]|uniref:hypothetical protein n=1 Tax=Thiohalocapsa sp. ML1 TaxID=1431688 RepID=UPI0007323119|nr:hypothetical protein [Thiohalocapsa sp. ML1]
MEKILLLASDAAWKALPKPLQERLTAHGAPAAGLGLPAGAHLPRRMALRLAAQHADAARILIADLRCAAALARLRVAGYVAERAGNRVYGGDATPEEVAALPGDTLLEQLLALRGDSANGADADQPAGLDLLEAQAWQRDGWAGLSAAGMDWTRAKAMQPPSSSDARADRFLDLADLTCLLVPGADEARLARESEAAATPDSTEKGNGYDPADPDPKQRDDGDYCQAMHRKSPVRLRATLAIGTPAGDDPSAARRLLLTTDRSRLHWLATLRADVTLQADLTLRLDVGRFRCRLHAELRAAAAPGAMDRLASRCLAVALVHGRPLRHYDCTFLLPLDLHEQDEGDDHRTGLPAKVNELLETRVKAHVLERLPDVHAGTAEDDKISAVARINAAIEHANRDPEQRRRLAAGLSKDEHLPHAQALLYFLPQVQRRVLDAEAGELAHWRLKPGNGAELKLRVEKSEYGDITVPIRELSLYRYDQDSFLLALRCTYSEPDAVSAWADRQAKAPDAEAVPTGLIWPDGDDWWHPLFTADPDIRGAIRESQAERWLTFTKSARLLRAAFPEQRSEGKLHNVVLLEGAQEIRRFDGSRSVNPIVHKLLGLLLGPDAEPSDQRPTEHDLSRCLQNRLAAVRDDRMVVNVAYGLAGPPPGADPAALDALRRLFSLALFVDRGRDAGADGWVYDRDFVAGQLAMQAEQRWAGLGTLIGCTNYSQAAVGCGALFCGPIARIHVPHIYGTMLVLSLLFELILAHFERRIAAETLRLQAPGGKRRPNTELQAAKLRRIECLHQDFIRFTNRTWLRHVSSQLQGEELFQRQAAALGLEAQYALVKDKLERTDELVQTRGARIQADNAHRLTRVGAYLAAASVLLSLVAFAVNPAPDPEAPATGLEGLWIWLAAWLNHNWPFVVALTIGVLTLNLLLRALRAERDDNSGACE